MRVWIQPLFPLYKQGFPPPVDTCVPIWDVSSCTGAVTGDICGDGSGRDVQVAEFRRCGWSVCQVAHQGDGAGAVVASCYGPLPGFVQEVPKSELYGFFMTLKLALPPVHYHTDCKWVVDGFRAGR